MTNASIAGAGVTVAVGATAAGMMMLTRRRATARAREAAGRWHVVTVNRDPSELNNGQRPDPLARLGDEVEIAYRTAPGGRGTEVAVRAAGAEPARLNGSPARAIRAALRAAKQVWETGEVLSPDRPGTTRRTLLNRPLEYATTHGREEGRL